MHKDVPLTLHEPRRSAWAFWILLVVGIAYGAFWYIEQPRSIPKPTTPARESSLPIDSLQAAVISSEIPDFSQEF